MLRAIERLDPLALFGRPWPELTSREQVELLAYATLREAEAAEEDRAVAGILKGLKTRRT